MCAQTCAENAVFVQKRAPNMKPRAHHAYCFPSHPASVSTPLDTLLVLQGAHQRRTPSQCSLVASKPFGTEFVTARDVTIRVCHCQGCYNPALNPSGCVCNSLSLSQCCSLQLSRSTDVVNFPLQPPAEGARGSVSVELR